LPWCKRNKRSRKTRSLRAFFRASARHKPFDRLKRKDGCFIRQSKADKVSGLLAKGISLHRRELAIRNDVVGRGCRFLMGRLPHRLEVFW
jgi:hypothetical protein